MNDESMQQDQNEEGVAADEYQAQVVVLDEQKSARTLRREARGLLNGKHGLTDEQKMDALVQARDKLSVAISVLEVEQAAKVASAEAQAAEEAEEGSDEG